MTVTRDATSGKYMPANASEWTQLLAGTGIANPTSLWLCQEVSGSLADSIGAKALGPNGSPTYSNAVSGWSRKAVNTSDGNVDTFSNATIQDPGAGSVMSLAWVNFPAAVATIERSVVTHGQTFGDQAALNIEPSSNPTIISFDINGGNGFGGHTNLGTQGTTGVHPVITQANHTAGVAVVQSDLETITATTYPNTSGAGFWLGGDNSSTWFAANAGYLYVAVWEGAAAELTSSQRSILLSRLSTGPAVQTNFQDVVVLNMNTLSFLGEAIVLGTDAGNKSLIFSNNAAELDLAANPSANRTIILPDASGTAGLITAISAGTTLASNGMVVFSNSNGMTFGLNGNTITASAGGGGGGVDIGAGTQTATSGTVVFSNSNGVSFGMSNSSIITASATVTTPAIAAGTQTAASGTAVFSNSNGVTFGMSNSSIVTASVSTQPGTPFAISAGTQSVSTGTVIFSASNGFTFGMSNSSIVTASGDYVRSISAGTTNATGNQVVFSNSNGVSFGANGATITAQMPSVSYWDNINAEIFFDAQLQTATAGVTNGALSGLSFQRLYLPRMSATRMDLIAAISAGSSQASLTLFAGLYTFAGSTASSVSTASQAQSWNTVTAASATSNYGGQSGTRWRSISLGTWNITPGEYLLAFMPLAQLSLAADSLTFAMLAGGLAGSVFNQLQVPGGGDYNAYFADGVYSTTATVFPASVNITDINQTFSSNSSLPVLNQPYIRLIGTGP
jgi:hypothetical protein